MRRSDIRSIASLFLALVICAGCSAFSLGRSSEPLTDFASATSRFDGHSWSPDGQLAFPSWSPDGKRLIVTRASDGALLSLDIAAVLKEKGVQP